MVDKIYNLQKLFSKNKNWLDYISTNSFNKLDVISDNLIKDIETFRIFPKQENIFSAFSFFNPDECKVVIIGQDPYHGYNQAMGLSFSVPKDVKIPPSLKNIFKEIKNDIYILQDIEKKYENGNLTYLANQGVLLLNRSLTVRESKPNSHKLLWREFTKEIIINLLKKQSNIVFLLWGNDAKQIVNDVDDKILEKHLILRAHHPSPLSANKGGWFGCKHFSKTNEYLIKNNKSKIEW